MQRKYVASVSELKNVCINSTIFWVVVDSGATVPPYYNVSVADDITLASMSADTIFSGSTDLSDLIGKATINIVDNFKLRKLSNLRMKIPRKSGDSKQREIILSHFFNELYLMIKKIDQESNSLIILGAPNLIRQGFLQYLDNKDSKLRKRIIR